MSYLYLDYFGLNKAPFQITPDIDFFFSGSRRGDILTALIHVACHEEGIVTAVAEVGSGKTLLARLMISRLPEHISTVYLANPCFTRDEIISAIARDLGLTDLPPSIEEKLARLHQELLRRHALNQRVLLVIDEAHAMPIESLEEVRLLSNLETSHHKLVNIMLFGQPELDSLLAEQRLRQVRDRVIHRFELPPLPRNEGAAYIDHRLRTAGWRGGNLLTSGATDLLLKASGGRARRINLLADKALLAAYAEGKPQVEEKHVRSAIKDLQSDSAPSTRPSSGLPWRQILPISLGLAVLMAGATVWIADRYRAAPATTNPPPTVATTLTTTPTATPTATPLPNPPTTTPTPKPPVTPTPAPAQPSPAAHNAPAPMAAPMDLARAATERTIERLRAQKLRGYTLQLTSLPTGSDLTKYLRFVQRYVDFPVVYAHNRIYKGKVYVAVYLGDFQTEQEARTALNELPKPLKTDAPVIRTWAGIQQETTQ